MPAPADDSKRRAARETIDILHEISTLLVRLSSRASPSFSQLTWAEQNTNLDRHTLSYCVSLIENGVNPEALAVSFLFHHWMALGVALTIWGFVTDCDQNVIKDLRAQNERFEAQSAQDGA